VKIVVSIPVHEKPEVINNQIENFKKYIENVIIVLHVSKGFFLHYSLKEIDQTDNVYINPTNLDTKWADIINTHISNFHYISSLIDFDYFVLHASNDMYIRPGFDKYISRYEAGFNRRKVIKKNSHWWTGNMALEDYQLKAMMDSCGQSMIIASQVESSFYKKELMKAIVSIIEAHYDDNSKTDIYPREEVYFSTIASKLVSRELVGYPTTFSEVHRFDRVLWGIRDITRYVYRRLGLRQIISQETYNCFEELYGRLLFKSKFYRTNKRIVKKLVNMDLNYINQNSYLNDGSGCFRLYNAEIFSVKRIERNIKDPVRVFISEL